MAPLKQHPTPLQSSMAPNPLLSLPIQVLVPIANGKELIPVRTRRSQTWWRREEEEDLQQPLQRGEEASIHKDSEACPDLSPKGRPSKPYDIKKATFTKKTPVLDLLPFPLSPTPPPLKSLATLLTLKDLASSDLDSLKGRLEHLHSEAIKEIDISVSRVFKKFKMKQREKNGNRRKIMLNQWSFWTRSDAKAF